MNNTMIMYQKMKKSIFVFSMVPLLAFSIIFSCRASDVEKGSVYHLKECFKEMHDPYQVVAPTKDDMARIVSWNVRSFTSVDGKDSLDEIVKTLRGLDPDVIVLQECYQNAICSKDGGRELIEHSWEKALNSLTTEKKEFSVLKSFANHEVYPTDNYRQQALAIATRFPVLKYYDYIYPDDLQYEPWPDSRLGFQVVHLNTSVGENVVVNVHLDVMDSSGTKRKKQLETIVDYLDKNVDPSLPILMMGDFNSVNFRQIAQNKDLLERILQQDINRSMPTSFHELEVLYKKGFNEVFDLAVQIPEVTVWSLRRVDYLFLRNGSFFDIKSQFLPLVYSDHLPMMTDIEIKK